MKTASKSSNGLNSKDVAVKSAPVAQNSEKAAKLLDKAKAAPAAAAPAAAKVEKAPAVAKVTKKSIVVEMISTKSGAKIDAIAQAIVDKGIDADLDKNKRVVRLWLCKIGFPVKRLDTGCYIKA